MDPLDIRIVRQLSQSGTVWPATPGLPESYRAIGRAIGVSPGTVRNRVREMSRTGFLQGTSVYPNVNLLGLRSGSYAIEISPSLRKRDVLEELGKVDGAVFFENFRGNELGIGLAYADERDLEETLGRIDRIARCARGSFSRVQHPPVSGVPKVPEWRLLSRLMASGFASYGQLAREQGVSVRTLKRRIANLQRTGAMLSFPKLDYRAVVGGVTAELFVFFADPAAKSAAESRILARLEDWLIYAGIWEEFDDYRLVLPNSSIAPELADEVRRFEGVRFARIEFVDSVIDVLGILRRLVERHAESARGADVLARTA